MARCWCQRKRRAFRDAAGSQQVEGDANSSADPAGSQHSRAVVERRQVEGDSPSGVDLARLRNVRGPDRGPRARPMCADTGAGPAAFTDGQQLISDGHSELLKTALRRRPARVFEDTCYGDMLGQLPCIVLCRRQVYPNTKHELDLILNMVGTCPSRGASCKPLTASVASSNGRAL